MSAPETEDQSGGGPANSFGNALAWNWTREMPRALKGGFLTLLYALRAMSAASGKLRFKDGTVIRIQDIAKASGCREQDARRYLEAAIRAGVIVVEGERRRGTPTLYVLNATLPHPDWKAAEAYLKATARRRAEDEPAEGGSGHSGTNSDGTGSVHSGTNQFGPQRHELEATDAETVRATVARPGSGHSGTYGSVHSGPNNPGVTQGDTHVEVGVVPQPEVVGSSGERNEQSAEPEDEPPFGRCEVCGKALVRPGSSLCAAHRGKPLIGPRSGSRRPLGAVQPPIVAVVPDMPPEAPARPPFLWKREDPLAPARICGCRRKFRSPTNETCQDCQYAAYQEAETA
ncbi:hypothetical protein ACWCPK_42800 [Streptomyces sp. NPDC001953]